MSEVKRPEWHGTYLDEDGIVEDILTKVRADPEAVKRWLDPDCWYMPSFSKSKKNVSEHGCLMFAGMNIRNWYGLWHHECPCTYNDGPDLEITNGIITDPRFADNISGRIIDRVKAKLVEEVNG